MIYFVVGVIEFEEADIQRMSAPAYRPGMLGDVGSRAIEGVHVKCDISTY